MTTFHRHSLLCICIASMQMICSHRLTAQEFQPLFSGKDLEGWTYTNTPPDMAR
ncbi:MAG: hypothetical protein U0892_20905 [Pirellulales bacterium]